MTIVMLQHEDTEDEMSLTFSHISKSKFQVFVREEDEAHEHSRYWPLESPSHKWPSPTVPLPRPYCHRHGWESKEGGSANNGGGKVKTMRSSLTVGEKLTGCKVEELTSY